jgi:probable F420-dependent oxidoreductase
LKLGSVGLFTTIRSLDGAELPEAAALAERLGFGAFWLGGSPRLPLIRPMLEASERLIVATGIVNVWQYEPAELAAEYADLASDFSERVLLGIGIGHPEVTADYSKPLTKMREFLDGLDEAGVAVPANRRCLAALGPKMLDLSRDRSLGAHPYFTPVEHTRFARARLGAAALLAPELACVIDVDAERARDSARRYAATYLRLRNYTSNLLAHGFSEQDLADGGSDRLLDAIVPHGTADDVAVAVRAHLDAGADHVCVQCVGVSGLPRTEWEALAVAIFQDGR